MVQTFWKTDWQFITKLNTLSSYDPAINAPWYLPKGAESLCLYKNMHTDVYSSFIHNCQVLETTKWYIQTLEYFSALKRNELSSMKTHGEGFPGGAVVENLPANAGDTGSSPGLGGSHMPRSNWAREPQLLSLRVWSLCSATREAAIVRGPRTAMKSGPTRRNWRKPSHRNEDPTQPKIKIINKLKIKNKKKRVGN